MLIISCRSSDEKGSGCKSTPSKDSKFLIDLQEICKEIGNLNEDFMLYVEFKSIQVKEFILMKFFISITQHFTLLYKKRLQSHGHELMSFR